MKFTTSCQKGAQLKNDNSDYQLREELCILFQDMIDCLMSSDNFQHYYKKNDLSTVVEYSLKDNTINTIDSVYIDDFSCYRNGLYTIVLNDAKHNKIIIVNVYPEECRIDINEQIDGGYNMFNWKDDPRLDLFELFEEAARWCKKINPEYW